MNEPFLPFALPDIGDEEIAEVVDSLKSGWLTTGPKTKAFEKAFAEFLGNGVDAIAVNSATAGLHLALEAVGVGPGDEVVTTPYTFTSTAEVVRYLGADPLFVDIEPKTLCIDPGKIEAALSPRTKAIIPVHIAGLACDMGPILEIARKHDLRIIEDAAHAFPSTCQGKLIGTLPTDATVYSFYATKTITTGEGGMVVSANPEIIARCKTMRLHGISRDVFDRYTSKKPSWFYEVVEPGFKYNMTDVAASMGIHQLNKAWTFRDKRASIASAYAEAFEDLPVVLPAFAQQGETHAWHLFILRLTDRAPVSRDCFIERMAEKGIGTSVHFIPLHFHPYWRERYGLKSDDYPNATRAYEAAVSLPIYTRMTEEDVQRVIRAVKEILCG